MPLPLRTITSLRTSFSPFSPLSRPCRLFLSLLQTPNTAPANSPSRIDIKVKHLPRDSKELPEMTVGFRGGKELRLEVGRLGLTVGDVIEDVARVGRGVSREESLKN